MQTNHDGYLQSEFEIVPISHFGSRILLIFVFISSISQCEGIEPCLEHRNHLKLKQKSTLTYLFFFKSQFFSKE